MCRAHLLGEHNEVHMLAGCIRKGKCLGRFLTDRLVDPARARARHDELAVEMRRRGYWHQSPLPAYEWSGQSIYNAGDLERHEAELRRRCPECKARGG
jgi:hypothetical protein